MKTSSCTRLSGEGYHRAGGGLTHGVQGPGDDEEHSPNAQHKQNCKKYCVSHVENHPFSKVFKREHSKCALRKEANIRT